MGIPFTMTSLSSPSRFQDGGDGCSSFRSGSRFFSQWFQGTR